MTSENMSPPNHQSPPSLAVFHLNRDCRIIGLNQAAETLTGKPLADLFGQNIDTVLALETSPDSLTQLFTETEKK